MKKPNKRKRKLWYFYTMAYHIYCDESRQCQDRFMVLGGIIVPEDNVSLMVDTMAKFRKEEGIHRELKWGKISNSWMPKYKRFIDFFFALCDTDKIHFKCIIVDNHQMDHRKYSNGNYEVGFYKMYYQLLLHQFGTPYYIKGQDTKFVVYLDYRNSKYELSDLKDILNSGISKKLSKGFEAISVEPFRNIEPRDSKQSEVIQLNDIILGAIGFHKNGYDLLANSSKAKVEIANYIANKAGINHLSQGTRYGQNRFAIWNFQFKNKKTAH